MTMQKDMMDRAVRDSFAKLILASRFKTRSCSWCGFPPS